MRVESDVTEEQGHCDHSIIIIAMMSWEKHQSAILACITLGLCITESPRVFKAILTMCLAKKPKLPEGLQDCGISILL